jgi:hypothetical protein
MELIVILFLAALAGYLLAGSRYRKYVDRAAETTATTSKSWTSRAVGWWNSRFGRQKEANAFRDWAAGPGSGYLPDDFKTWLAGLSDDEAKSFTHSLESYASGLGFDLNKVVKGDLNNQPALLQVFVEAVVVYSGAYRKARQVQQEAGAVSVEEGSPPVEEPEKKTAEKSVSRRKSDTGEVSEPAPVS